MYALKLIAVVIIGYAMGLFPTGVMVAKKLGNIDIRKVGSGNTGTTNVLRTLGWKASLLTLLGDALKGALPALIGMLVCGTAGMLTGGLCAILGHDYPATRGFKGGKGIATSFGAILVINPLIGLILFVSAVIIIALTKYMSIASIFECFWYPALTAIFYHEHADFALYIIFAAVYGVLALFAHRSNIKRLLDHNENKLDFKKINKLSSKKK